MPGSNTKLFYFRSEGSGSRKVDHWFSYLVGTRDHYVLHEWSPAEGNPTGGAGVQLYTVSEFLRDDQFNGRPKVKLGELLRAE